MSPGDGHPFPKPTSVTRHPKLSWFQPEKHSVLSFTRCLSLSENGASNYEEPNIPIPTSTLRSTAVTIVIPLPGNWKRRTVFRWPFGEFTTERSRKVFTRQGIKNVPAKIWKACLQRVYVMWVMCACVYVDGDAVQGCVCETVWCCIRLYIWERERRCVSMCDVV